MKIKLLIISEHGLAQVLRTYFKERGLEAFFALIHKEKEILKITKKENPQIIFLDMSTMNGVYELGILKQLKKICRYADIYIGCTPPTYYFIAEKIKRFDIAGYIEKLYKIKDLEQLIIKSAEKFKQKNKDKDQITITQSGA